MKKKHGPFMLKRLIKEHGKVNWLGMSHLVNHLLRASNYKDALIVVETAEYVFFQQPEQNGPTLCFEVI